MPDHFREAERLVSEASFQRGVTGAPVTREGLPMSNEQHARLVGRAQAQASLALAQKVDELTQLLAAWRADIDREPIRVPPSVVDFAAEPSRPIEWPTPCFGCGAIHELNELWGGRDQQVRCRDCQQRHEAEAP